MADAVPTNDAQHHGAPRSPAAGPQPRAGAEQSAALLVAVSASAGGSRLVEQAVRRVRPGARWFAVHIETANDARMGAEGHSQLAENLSLAEELGAETVILPAVDPVGELLRFAREHGVTEIVVGKPRHRWSSWFGRFSVVELARRSEQFDICVLPNYSRGVRAQPAFRASQRRLARYLSAVLLVALCTLINIVLIQPHLPLRNVVMVYLLGVTVAAMRFGRGPSALAAVLSVMMFDFVFVAPTGVLASSTTPDVITFGVMLAIGLTISTLAGHVSFQVQAARQREQRMSALFAMSREFATLRSQEEIARAAERHIGDAVAGETAVMLIDERGRPVGGAAGATPRWSAGEDEIVAWVAGHNERAGSGSDSYPDEPAMYLPLSAAQGCVGVLRVRPRSQLGPLSSERRDLLNTLTSLTALALERARWVDAAERARLDTEAERLRNSLLSAISHDLRTPLAAIVGSSSTLVELGEQLGSSARLELAESILDEGERLNRQVANLLDMTRLGSGSLRAQKEWEPVEEVIGVVLERLQRLLKNFPVEMHLEPDLPPVPMDDRLIQQVLVNLIENSIKYSRPGTPITLSAWGEERWVHVEVGDRGPGMSERDLSSAFNRFYRSPATAKEAGTGLGLTICHGILSLHEGRIQARNRSGGGLAVRLSLPLPVEPQMAPAEFADQAAGPTEPAPRKASHVS